MEWSKICEGLSRGAGRFADALRDADGDRAEAAKALWTRARHDTALREDLLKAACALFALAPVEAGRRPDAPPAAPLTPPRKLTKFDRDPELASFVRERLGTMSCRAISDAARERFGRDRGPGHTTVWNYWKRLAEHPGAGSPS